MLCTKDTAMAAGLNIWVNGDHNNKGPEVEYEMRDGVQIISLTNLPALSQSKALVRINTTHGSRSETWLSRRNPANFIYPGFFINTVPQLRN